MHANWLFQAMEKFSNCLRDMQKHTSVDSNNLFYNLPDIPPSIVDVSSLLVPGVILEALSNVPAGDCWSNTT